LQLDVIDQSRIDLLLLDRSEEACRYFTKVSLSYLGKAPKHLTKLQAALNRRNMETVAARAAAFREASEKVGAKRIAALCKLLESGSQELHAEHLLDQLAEEVKAAERRIWKLAKDLGTAAVRKSR